MKYILKNILINKKYYIINFIFLFIISMICNYCFFTVKSAETKMTKIEDYFSSRYTFTTEDGYNLGIEIDSNINIEQAITIIENERAKTALTKEEIINLCRSDYVEDFTLICSTHAFFENISPVMGSEYVAPVIDGVTYSVQDFPLEGYYRENNDYDINMIDEFMLGISKLVKGRLFEKDDEIIISDKVAELNGLDINETVTATNGHKLVITGIFSVTGSYAWNFGLRKNKYHNDVLNNIIYTTFDTMQSFTSTDKISVYDACPIFSIQSKENAELFYYELLEKGYPKNLYVMNDRTLNTQITFDLDMMRIPLLQTYYFCIPAGCVISFLLILIMLKGRRFDFAVLISMGMGKARLALNLIIENSLFILAVLSAGIITAKFTSPLIISLVYPELMRLFDLKTAFSAEAVMQYLLYAMALAVVSALVFALSIVRFSPVKLLTEEKE